MDLKVSLAKIKMIEMGIVPAITGNDLENMLSSLSDAERKKVKRKFRKEWRKLRRQDKSLEFVMGGDIGEDPTRSQKRNRSVFIVSSIMKSISV